jgi:F-type H+-transporting ATPase subunit delta
MAAVASRYARAFADVVLKSRLDAAAARQQLASVVEIVGSNAQLRRVWENPAVPADQKRRLLDAIVARAGFSQQLRNFIAVLVDHRRIPILAQVARQFELELNQRLGLTDAEITSARELRDDEKRALESQIERLTGKRVRARYGTDSGILGGAIVRLGSTIYDGSVRGQLHKIKEQLSAE